MSVVTLPVFYNGIKVDTVSLNFDDNTSLLELYDEAFSKLDDELFYRPTNETDHAGPSGIYVGLTEIGRVVAIHSSGNLTDSFYRIRDFPVATLGSIADNCNSSIFGEIYRVVYDHGEVADCDALELFKNLISLGESLHAMEVLRITKRFCLTAPYDGTVIAAVKNGDLGLLRAIVEKNFFTVSAEHKKIKPILQRCFNIDEQDSSGMTAAHHAASNGDLGALKILSDCGIDLTIENSDGENVTFVAESLRFSGKEGGSEVFSYLRGSGPLPGMNYYGETPEMK